MPTSANAPGSMRGSLEQELRARARTRRRRGRPCTSDGPKSPALPPLPTVSDVATIFTSASQEQRARTPGQPVRQPGRAGDRDLRRAVAAAEDAEPLPGLPDARAHEHRRRGSTSMPSARPPSAGRAQAGTGSARGDAAARRAASDEKSAGEERDERAPAARRAAGAPGRTGSAARARRASTRRRTR